MISSRELKLGKIALKRGMVEKEQIDQCLRLKKKLAKEKGKKVALGALLLKKGYLSKEQLEEIVAIHDKAAAKAEAKAGGKPASAKSSKTESKSRRSKRATQNGVAAAEGDEKDARRKRAKTEGKRSTGASAKRESVSSKRESASTKRASGKTTSARKATGSRKRETAEAGDDPRKSAKKASVSRKRETGGDKPESSKRATRSKSKRVSATTKAVKDKSSKDRLKARGRRDDPSQNGALASDVFLSATESAVDEVDKRIVACPSCGKKYRVREKQVGKRFNCRRCETKIKVPKDLFERALEPESGVDEFTLSGSDVLDSAELQAAAAVAQQSVQKVQRKSIADLAQAAEKHQKKGLGPRTKFGTPQLITLAVSLVVLGGVVYGLVWYSGRIEAEQKAQLEERIRSEYEDWNTELGAAMQELGALAALEGDEFNAALESGQLANVQAKIDALRQQRPSSGGNLAKAEAREQELEIDGKVRALLGRQAEIYRAMGGYQIDNAIDALKAAAAIDPSNVDGQLDLAGLLLSVRRTAQALEVLGPLSGEGAEALKALAMERGGNAAAAAEGYGKLEDPLGKVLAARAFLTQGDAKLALDKLAGLDLQGEDKAVGKLIEGYAAEALDRDAERAFSDAIDASESSPYPRVARGEYYVRIGKPQPALKDFLAANRAVPTARGYLGLGDAQLLLHDLEKAQRAYEQAIKLSSPPKDQRRVAGRIDPYVRPLAPDPRSMARVRQGMLAWMQGDVETGRTSFQSARTLDPTNPLALAAQAHLEILAKTASPEIPALIAEASKLQSGLSPEAGERALLPNAVSAYVLVVRAAMEVDAGQHDAAGESLTAAERCFGAEKAAISALRIQLYQAQGRDSLALKEAQGMHEAETSERTELGRVYLSAKAAVAALDASNRTSVEEARAGVLACLVRDPYHVSARVLLAKLSIQVGEWDTAIQALQRAEEINPYQRDVFVTRGFLNVRDLPDERQTRETKAQAEKDFAFALELEQRTGGPQAETLYGQALVQFQQRRLLDAQQKINACLEVDADYAPAYKLRAEVLRSLNQPGAEEAQAKYEELSQGG